MDTSVKRTPALILLFTSIALVIVAGLFMMSPANSAATDPSIAKGRWLTESGNLEIDVSTCGDRLCGVVSRVLSNRSMSRPNQDTQPADGKSALNMEILSDFVVAADGSWLGKIYNRENGKTYDCIMKGLSPDKLEIRAYKFLPIFGKTQIWTRVSGSTAVPQT